MQISLHFHKKQLNKQLPWTSRGWDVTEKAGTWNMFSAVPEAEKPSFAFTLFAEYWSFCLLLLKFHDFSLSIFAWVSFTGLTWESKFIFSLAQSHSCILPYVLNNLKKKPTFSASNICLQTSTKYPLKMSITTIYHWFMSLYFPKTLLRFCDSLSPRWIQWSLSLSHRLYDLQAESLSQNTV